MWKSVTLGLALALIAGTAWAQPQCDNRDKVLSLLSEKYKESPVAIGVTNNGGLVEVLSTNEGTTWSIIVTNTEGLSCLVAAGEGWRALEQVALDNET